MGAIRHRDRCVEPVVDADGGYALMLRARQKAIWETEQPAIGAAVDDPDWYIYNIARHAIVPPTLLCCYHNSFYIESTSTYVLDTHNPH